VVIIEAGRDLEIEPKIFNRFCKLKKRGGVVCVVGLEGEGPEVKKGTREPEKTHQPPPVSCGECCLSRTMKSGGWCSLGPPLSS